MQDRKHLSWARNLVPETVPDTTPVEDAANDCVAHDPDGWAQYRNWISKAPAPNRRRSGLDPTLYSWKGYRNWAERVKRNWQDD